MFKAGDRVKLVYADEEDLSVGVYPGFTGTVVEDNNTEIVLVNFKKHFIEYFVNDVQLEKIED